MAKTPTPIVANPNLVVTPTAAQPFKLPKQKPEILAVTPAMVMEYIAWFVNRRAFCRQSDEPGKSRKHYYYRPQHPDARKWAYAEAKSTPRSAAGPTPNWWQSCMGRELRT